MSKEALEGRNETVAAAISEADKWRVKLVSKREGRSISDLMYEHSLNDLIELGRRLEAALENVS